MNSLKDVAEDLKAQHMKFIEAGYHLRHDRLIKERRALMQSGAVASEPWVEMSPNYQMGKPYRDLNLDPSMVELLNSLAREGLVFERPLKHQADALEAFFAGRKDLLVSTGTGSGKTEIFLYSILGMLAQEADRRDTLGMRSFRALILYPMNALVADQLARLRLLLGDPRGASIIEERFGRRVQFGMYTSRTPYHGRYNTKRNDIRVKPIIDYYCQLREHEPHLFEKLKSRGRVPAKDIIGFRNKHQSKETQFRTQPGDVELFTRQEMHEPNEYGGTPDILITNYSMLEYMLLRPIEQPMFNETRAWLDDDPTNQLTVVLDEAHLYRGAQGAEIALLIRRLLQHLNIGRARARFILTSATLGTDETAKRVGPKFGADLTGGEAVEFEVVTSAEEVLTDGGPGSPEQAEVLEKVGYKPTPDALAHLARLSGWGSPQQAEVLDAYLADNLPNLAPFRLLQEALSDGPAPLGKLASRLFPEVSEEVALDATGNLLYLGTIAQHRGNQSLLPARLHLFFKGLPNQYACVDPGCSERRAVDDGAPLLGRLYSEPRNRCDCGARVFELLSHRTCGAAYLRAYRHPQSRTEPEVFLWTERGTDRRGSGVGELEEVHLLLEKPRENSVPGGKGISLLSSTAHRHLDIRTGHLIRHPPEGNAERFIKVWVPGNDQRPADPSHPWSWTRCPACGIQERRRHGQTKIMDLETKGEETFANLVKAAFQYQPPDEEKLDLPNEGRKILCFSDSRQQAATLARDLQRTVELDSFREVVVAARSRLPDKASMECLFPAIAAYTRQRRIGFFDDGDRVHRTEGYPGSRTQFVKCQKLVERMADRRGKEVGELATDRHAMEDLNRARPRKYDQALLRLLGHNNFSITATLVGYLRPMTDIVRQVHKVVSKLPRGTVNPLLLEVLRLAASEEAYDPEIDDRDRRRCRGYPKDREGLTESDIVPDHLKHKLMGRVPDDAWTEILDCVIYPDEGARLFVPLRTGRYVINPAAVTLELALDHEWLRCAGCKQFSGWAIGDVCPRQGCRGTMSTVDADDLHLRARNALLRDPCSRVVFGTREPFTLRAEEHSAQLNAKDRSDPFSKTERYELLFQDILIGESEVEQPIDVLSCTTTMEVGIDIGSLTGVAMRTIPPRPENYQQRSGRAGRRDTGLSTILTFADNSPHEAYYFKNPHRMVGAEASEPVVYTGNRKIAERHINASLLERFFDPLQVDESADVFRSLGTSRDFFEGDGRYCLLAFEEWLEEEIWDDSSTITELLGRLLPVDLRQALPEYGEDWRSRFVQDTGRSFLNQLKDLAKSTNWSGTDRDKDLLSTLLDAALLPTFSFPIDTCKFVVREVERDGDGRRIKNSYEMTRDLKVALSSYIPGRQLVVDKKSFTSYGVYYPFARDPVNRAADEDWDSLEWLNFCPKCETVVQEKERNLSLQDGECEVCESAGLKSKHIYRPPAFAPEVEPVGQAEEGKSWEQDRVYASPAKYPIPAPGKEGEKVYASKSLEKAEVRRMWNQELMVVNFGPANEGFHVCRKCGAVGRDGPLKDPHNRPYPRDFRVRDDWPAQCSGSFVNATFGYSFTTDLSLLRIPITSPVKFAPNRDWFRSSTKSLAEALVLGATRTLGLDTNELAGGRRTLPRMQNDAPEINGYMEFFLYDTTPGGAGFASKVFDRFQGVVKQTKNILEQCSCARSCHSCLRTYNNKLWHRDLDRHLALTVLEYATSGTVPRVERSVARALARELGLTLELMEPRSSIFSVAGANPTWRVELSGASVDFRIRSCLLEGTSVEDADALGFSDFALSHELPRVAYEIVEALGDCV